MDKDYQFFICGNEAQWSEGIMDNLVYKQNGIQLSSRKAFIYQQGYHVDHQMVALFKGHRKNEIIDVVITASGVTYLLDRYDNVWLLQHQEKQLSHIYHGHENQGRYKRVYCNQKILLITNKESLRMIDIKVGQIIRDMDVQDILDGELMDCALSDTKLYLVQKKEHDISVLVYDIFTGMVHHEYTKSNLTEDVQCVIKVVDGHIYLAIHGDTLIIVDENKEASSIQLDEKLLDFYPTEDGYYVAVSKRQSDYRLLTMIYQLNKPLTEKYFIKEHYGLGKKLFVDHNQMYHWFHKYWRLDIYELGDVYSGNSKDDVVQGYYISKCYDAYNEHMKWHRMMVSSRIQHNTRMKLSFYATDASTIPYKNKSYPIKEIIVQEDLTFEEKRSLLCQKNYLQESHVNVKDGLFQKTQGRYFWFEMELIGTPVLTPYVEKFQWFYDRKSYLRYLPEVYQEDQESAFFLERFLSLYESYLSDMEETIDHNHDWLNPRVTPVERLNTLSTWLGFDFDDTWDENQIRTMLQFAPELYKRKGTKFVLQTVLEIYLASEIHIIESHELKDKCKKLNLYDDNPFVFYILIEKEALMSKVKKANVIRIVDWLKPAFSEGKLIILEDAILLGDHCYIGMNSKLASHGQMLLDDQTYLLNNTVLHDELEPNRLGKDTKLDDDTYLE